MCATGPSSGVVALISPNASVGDGAVATGKAQVPPLPTQAYGLLVAVFLDLVAVAMVIPLLPGRFRQLGVTPATYVSGTCIG